MLTGGATCYVASLVRPCTICRASILLWKRFRRGTGTASRATNKKWGKNSRSRMPSILSRRRRRVRMFHEFEAWFLAIVCRWHGSKMRTAPPWTPNWRSDAKNLSDSTGTAGSTGTSSGGFLCEFLVHISSFTFLWSGIHDLFERRCVDFFAKCGRNISLAIFLSSDR